MNDRPSDLAQLRVLLRQLSRGELLIIAERAVELVPSAGLASLLGDFLQIEVSGEGCVNFGVMKQQNLAMAADAQSGF